MAKIPTIADNMPRGDDWIVQKLAAHDRELAELSAARTLEAASIGRGGLTVLGGFVKISQDGSLQIIDQDSGYPVLYAGKATTVDDGRQMVFEMFRDDGTVALVLADLGTVVGHPHQQALQWFDRAGNIVFADDTVSGVGIATPYIPAGSWVDITSPTVTTNSASFVPMQWADVVQQHPRVRGVVLCQTPAGTTGQIRMTIGGQQIGAVVSVPANTFTTFVITESPWPAGTYSFQQEVIVQLEARVTAGAGAIGVRGMGLWGVQS